ncbi:MopE-related protein [Sandaracinus amylolyticus]|uniref:MopE-related protein n=1 Tax=Sandaracinus amylolyticus TaxID=927083 RepID=UPI00069E2A41|nr:MopE-related protein [Sandaracinus amylolyticus]
MSRFVSSAQRLALLVVLSSCTVEPYCLVCPDVDGGEPLDGGTDAGSDARVAPRDASADVIVVPDGACIDFELCNERDDDCDGHTDEGIDTESNPDHCGGCDMPCPVYPHAFAVCEAGECSIGACDVGYLDLDPAQPGCEYYCIPTVTDGTDEICDFNDDDCDGAIDEDIDFANDPENCGFTSSGAGRCGNHCRGSRAAGSCSAGVCTLGACDPGYYDIDGSATNGCEYQCTPADPPVEVCNLLDDDCDGTVDDGEPGAGVACGSDVGACGAAAGVTICRAGEIVCTGEPAPAAETCNTVDDDCDGRVDENNPEGGRVCGISTGACEVGTQQCVGGALVCMGQVEATAEICNTIDDDCDGAVDDGNPGGGAACGPTAGACEAGVVTCTRGALVCTGGVGPSPELCNNVDDDCDGNVDEGDPEGGQLCGSDVGRCAPGVQHCRSGSLVCEGAITATTETCDGVDQDCDSNVDEGNPGGGAACGETAGACEAGTVQCRGGTLTCEGAIGPTVELCNGTNDDCDAMTDEGFALMTDINNCGACGRVCSFPNATPRCNAGTCAIAACRPGFVDLDPTRPGCEYACSFAGNEACNGRDDDCDGRTDEGLTAPSAFCNPNGVCNGTAATCGGARGWECVYPATYQQTEQRCDSLDNDCDGSIDEAFPLVGDQCSNGSGTCRRVGTYVCAASGTAVQCNAAAAGTPGDESCNGADDDCDGEVDETGVNDPGTPWRDAIDASAIPTVTYTSGGRTIRVMRYEASRPDATSTSAGSLSTLACSAPNVRPWTSVTWAEAEAACCALNASGTCTSPTSGWHLCGAEDWETACEGPAGSCDWSYAATCSATQPVACNGMEYDSNTSLAGDQDALATTGSPTFSSCYTDWAAAGRVYDMSGNVREWTSTSAGTSGGVPLYQVRGGSYQSIEEGRTCDFDFTVAQRTFRAPTTGFRCCMY